MAPIGRSEFAAGTDTAEPHGERVAFRVFNAFRYAVKKKWSTELGVHIMILRGVHIMILRGSIS